MIISHEYKYVFVEFPHTASTAISRELCENYKGRPILKKHSHLRDFLKVASEQEKAFLVIASMRNPMDIIVTRYYKMKTNHQGMFTDPKYRVENGGHLSIKAYDEYRFIQEHNASFAAYFHRFYWYPFDAWGCPSPDDFDFIIRYENLQNDFGGFLDLLKISQFRSLPLINKTDKKDDDFWTYYESSIRKQTVWVFSPFFNLWGYQFPTYWGVDCNQTFAQYYFTLMRLIRRFLIATGFYYKAT